MAVDHLATSERIYTAEEQAVLKAMANYRQQNPDQPVFLSVTDYLKFFKDLGYRCQKQAPTDVSEAPIIRQRQKKMAVPEDLV